MPSIPDESDIEILGSSASANKTGRRFTRSSLATASPKSSTMIPVKRAFDADSEVPLHMRVQFYPDIFSQPDSGPISQPVLAPAPVALPLRAVSKIFNDPKADFEIVSQDDVIIRIHKYHLLSNSPFFRKAEDDKTLRSPYRIRHFNAEAIEDLLALMTRLDCPWILATGAPFPHFRVSRLVKICKAFDCSQLLTSLSTILRDAIASPGHPETITYDTRPFYVAVMLDDWETCRRAIILAASQTWSNPSSSSEGETALDQRVQGRSVFDISGMSQKSLKRLPLRVVMALSRAYLLRGRGEGGDGDWEKVASEFHRLMTLKPHVVNPV